MKRRPLDSRHAWSAVVLVAVLTACGNGPEVVAASAVVEEADAGGPQFVAPQLIEGCLPGRYRGSFVPRESLEGEQLVALSGAIDFTLAPRGELLQLTPNSKLTGKDDLGQETFVADVIADRPCRAGQFQSELAGTWQGLVNFRADIRGVYTDEPPTDIEGTTFDPLPVFSGEWEAFLVDGSRIAAGYWTAFLTTPQP